MSADFPTWQAFDPSAGNVPEAISSLAVGGGDPRVIVLLMMPGIDGRWGAEASVGIARAWDDTGDGVLLSDLDLREPKLHEVLGHENGQGVSDILLYGVSVQHVTFASETGSFMVATAGTPVADPEAVLAHPRWDAVTRGLLDSGVSVLLHLPSDLPGAASLLARADHVVVFAADASAAEGIDGAVAVLGPPVEEPAEVAPAPEMDEPEAVEEPADEPVEGIDVAEEMADAVIEAVSDEDEADEPAAEEPVAAEPVSAEDGFGDFALDEPAAVDEPAAPAEGADAGGGDLSFDALDGGQYAEDASTDEEEEDSTFDVGSLDDMAVEESTGADDSLDLELPFEVGLESTSTIESMPVADEAATSDPDEEEPAFDIGDGLELEAPELPADAPLSAEEPPLTDEEPAPVFDADADSVSEPGGDVLEVERSSIADADLVAPADTSMISGVEHGAGVATELPPESLVDAAESLSVEDSPIPTEPTSEDVDVATEVPAADEPSGEAQQDEIDEGGELWSQPERKMSGLDELARRQKWKERRGTLLTAVAVIVILGGGGYGLAFFGIVDVPGITPVDRLSGAGQAPIQLEGPQPTTPIVSHSLLINTYRTPETPRELVGVLAERLPGTLFFYTPLMIDERLQYALFAGPAYSALQADNLKQPLVEVLDRLNPDEWLVRATSYAFFFGEYDDATGGDARVEELAGLSIPAYVLHVDYADGRTRVRVYAGAFTDQFEAEPLDEVISDSRLSAVPLIERRGRLPE